MITSIMLYIRSVIIDIFSKVTVDRNDPLNEEWLPLPTICAINALLSSRN